MREFVLALRKIFKYPSTTKLAHDRVIPSLEENTNFLGKNSGSCWCWRLSLSMLYGFIISIYQKTGIDKNRRIGRSLSATRAIGIGGSDERDRDIRRSRSRNNPIPL